MYLSGIINAVEQEVSGIQGQSFVDNIGWWADGIDDKAAAAQLSGRQWHPLTG